MYKQENKQNKHWKEQNTKTQGQDTHETKDKTKQGNTNTTATTIHAYKQIVNKTSKPNSNTQNNED